MKHIIRAYLDSLRYKNSPATRKTYVQGIKTYVKAVGANATISLETYIKFLKSLHAYPSPTQRVYRAAVVDMYKFFCNEHSGNVNMLAMESADERYLKRTEKRKLHFDRDAVNVLVDYICSMRLKELADYRDKAFVLFLVDSGIRIAEACALKRGQIPWKTGELYIIGKGDKEEKVYFSNRALEAMKQYLDKRAKLDGKTGLPLESLPLFSRHDLGSGSKVKTIGSGGMWYSFVKRMTQAGIDKSAISPHILRHEAITRYYEATKDIKKTMGFSRHARMDTVDRYTHLVDKSVRESYDEAFNQRKK